ncbi:MAG TPA: zf-HC2 domain-containing protein [Blastocatellia bacterium]|nr:zf-HC2 domain-containing protein [Blastocatellia bacterium]
MFIRHASKYLSAYCHGELDDKQARRVSEHLLRCEGCRREYDDIKLAVRLAERLPQVSAPDTMWSEIEELLDRQARMPSVSPTHAGFSFAWYKLAGAAAATIAIIIFGSLWFYNYGPKASWTVDTLAGKIRIASEYISGSGRLAEGEVLETVDDSRARLAIGAIGHVDIDPNSRVRLIDASMTEHRIELARGRLEATISAPPRLFFVNTPSAVAIDLGCKYTLEVDDQGNSFLHVTSGFVALERDGRETVVPVGAMCETRFDRGPGTPYFETASDALQDALSRFDFDNGGDAALDVVLAESTERDTFTLWNLLPRVNETQRKRVLDRMIALVGLPEGITREGTMRLDKEMLQSWWDAMDTVWF